MILLVIRNMHYFSIIWKFVFVGSTWMTGGLEKRRMAQMTNIFCLVFVSFLAVSITAFAFVFKEYEASTIPLSLLLLRKFDDSVVRSG